ncbi:ArpU family phage packaging/lysis transcriptional regulator [Enterococcus sp. AZ103]|uniref:ArpU family phage packaging/lysis transcriptional regulator n=1 Tax=Enterococcus sp. AZ103 TaxID=2774628 RepID=UPI003F246F7D
MALIPEIDKRKTKMNARKVLVQYRKWERIAGKSSIDIKSPLISDMPRTLGVSVNKSQDGIVERVDAEINRDAILRALAALSWRSRQILSMTYCEHEKASVYEIGLNMGYSEIRIKELRGIALIEFSEAYKNGQLLSYE